MVSLCVYVCGQRWYLSIADSLVSKHRKERMTRRETQRETNVNAVRGKKGVETQEREQKKSIGPGRT